MIYNEKWNVMKEENKKWTNKVDMKWYRNKDEMNMNEYEMQMRNCNGWNEDVMRNVIEIMMLGVKWCEEM